MSDFVLGDKVDNNKVFFIKRSDLLDRWDSTYVFNFINNKIKYKFNTFKFSDLVRSYSGGTPSKNHPEYWNGNIPWVSSKDMKSFYLYSTEDSITELGLRNSSSKIAVKNSLLMVVRSGILLHTLPIAINKTEVAINQDIKFFVPIIDNILTEYLGFFFVVFNDYALKLLVKHSTTVQSVNTNELQHLPIPVPPIQMQQKIIDLMNSAYSLRADKLRQANELLDSIDTYLLNELGITMPKTHYGGIKDRMFITKFSEVADKRLDPSIWSKRITIFSSCYPVYSLSDLFFVDPATNYGSVQEISFIPMDAVDERFGEIKYYSTKSIKEIQGLTKFQEGDILWAKITPCMHNGKSTIALNLKNNFGCGSTEFFVLRVKDCNIALPILFLYFLRNKTILNFAKLYYGGSAGQQRVHKSFFDELKIALPPLDKQKEIANTISSMRQQAKTLELEGEKILEDAKREIEKMILG